MTNLDAFGRLRTSAPYAVFSNTSSYDTEPFNREYSATGTGASAKSANEGGIDLTVAADNDVSIRQTRGYFPYQPGKSQLVYMTCVPNTDANARKRWGYFDEDDGIFFELAGDVFSVNLRSSVGSGSGSDTSVTTANFNLCSTSNTGSPYHFTSLLNDEGGPLTLDIDFTKANIYVIDMQWLGVGRVRTGVATNDGQIFWLHEFRNANANTDVYMLTAFLPVRWEIEATGTITGTPTFKTICSTVMSEGGFENFVGTPFSINNGIAGEGVSDASEPVLAIRPKATLNSFKNRGVIIPTGFQLTATTNDALVEVYLVTGSITDASWTSAGANSLVEYDVSGTALTGTNYKVASVYVNTTSKTAAGNLSSVFKSFLPLSTGINGNSNYALAFVATPFTGTSTVHVALDWNELR